MRNRSYWEKDTFSTSYDLIVIGAGITGLSTALFYKRKHPGRSVLVLDRGIIPQGASTRNAGFVCIGSISEHQADLERTSESEVKNRIRRRYEGIELLKTTLGENEIDYECCGGYELFTEGGTFQKAERELSKFNNWLSDLIQEEEVYSIREINGHVVICNRLEGALHPGKMMRVLIAKAEDEGVQIHWNSAVVGIDAGGVVLLDDGTEFNAGQIVVATNGFARQLLPDLALKPGRGYVFITNPIEGQPWRGIFYHDEGYIYFRNVGDRLLLGGARNIAEREEETNQFGINPVIKDHLVEFASETLGLGSEWEIEQEWSGIMGFTESKSPVIEHVEGSVFVAAGLSGMGIAIGMRVGKVATALLDSKSG